MKSTDRQRGQFILFGAVLLAVLLIGLTTILNTAVYTETLASRGDTSGADNAIRFRTETATAVSGLLSETNTDRAMLKRAIEDWGETTALHYARNGAETHVTVLTTNDVDTDGTIDSVDLRVSYRTEQVQYETTLEVRAT